jgi:Zn ribbon nucleic-acid-binding protein
LKCRNCEREYTVRLFIDDRHAFIDCSWCGFREDLEEETV